MRSPCVRECLIPRASFERCIDNVAVWGMLEPLPISKRFQRDEPDASQAQDGSVFVSRFVWRSRGGLHFFRFLCIQIRVSTGTGKKLYSKYFT